MRTRGVLWIQLSGGEFYAIDFENSNRHFKMHTCFGKATIWEIKTELWYRVHPLSCEMEVCELDAQSDALRYFDHPHHGAIELWEEFEWRYDGMTETAPGPDEDVDGFPVPATWIEIVGNDLDEVKNAKFADGMVL